MNDDLISRRAAIEITKTCDFIRDNNIEGGSELLFADDVRKRLEELPSAQPERKKGKWIDGNEGKWNAVYCPKCSVCGTSFYGIETVRYHYCPNCGARMEESDGERYN